MRGSRSLSNSSGQCIVAGVRKSKGPARLWLSRRRRSQGPAGWGEDSEQVRELAWVVLGAYLLTIGRPPGGILLQRSADQVRPLQVAHGQVGSTLANTPSRRAMLESMQRVAAPFAHGMLTNDPGRVRMEPSERLPTRP